MAVFVVDVVGGVFRLSLVDWQVFSQVPDQSAALLVNWTYTVGFVRWPRHCCHFVLTLELLHDLTWSTLIEQEDIRVVFSDHCQYIAILQVPLDVSEWNSLFMFVHYVRIAQLSRVEKAHWPIFSYRSEDCLLKTKAYVVDGFLMGHQLRRYLRVLNVPNRHWAVNRCGSDCVAVISIPIEACYRLTVFRAID